METLSPATALKDRTVKKEKYALLGIDEYWIVSPKERAVEVYYLEEKQYHLVSSYILVEDVEDKNYNAEAVLTLKAMPAVAIVLKDIFKDIE